MYLMFFFETFQLWIDSKDQLSFRYMNPYDFRKLSSRNLQVLLNYLFPELPRDSFSSSSSAVNSSKRTRRLL